MEKPLETEKKEGKIENLESKENVELGVMLDEGKEDYLLRTAHLEDTKEIESILMHRLEALPRRRELLNLQHNSLQIEMAKIKFDDKSERSRQEVKETDLIRSINSTKETGTKIQEALRGGNPIFLDEVKNEVREIKLKGDIKDYVRRIPEMLGQSFGLESEKRKIKYRILGFTEAAMRKNDFVTAIKAMEGVGSLGSEEDLERLQRRMNIAEGQGLDVTEAKKILEEALKQQQ